MNLKSFFTTQYLFQVNPAFISPAEKLFFLSGIVFLLLSIVLKIASILSTNPVERKYRQKFYKLFLTIGLAELAWYLCRFENIRFFETRFVIWLVILFALIWFTYLVFSTIKNYSSEKNLWSKEQMRQKYLPK